MLKAVFMLLSAIPALSVLLESSGEAQLVFGNLSCTRNQTECPFGCCPYADAVCCPDELCCRNSQVCTIFRICIGNKQNGTSLMSSKATRTENLVTSCPSGSTTCGIGKCCLSPNATCCEDGMHCCDYGYRCDIGKKRCSKNVDYNFYLPTSPSIELFQIVRKDPYKSCPGGTKVCPSYMSCCLNDGGGWGCCPNPSSPVYRKKGNSYLKNWIFKNPIF